MESIAVWFTNTLGQYVSEEIVIFIISMIPILELRGGLIAASLLKVSLVKAIQIFKWLGKTKLFHGLIERLERKAMSKSDRIKQWEFWGLALFVGIPLPGTGAWTGSLIAALLEIDIKKAVLAELVGIAMATIIMSVFSYGLLGAILG